MAARISGPLPASPSPARAAGADRLAVASAVVLVGVEVLGATVAAGWALAGLMGLGREVEIALIGLGVAAGLWGTYKFARSAMASEKARGR